MKHNIRSCALFRLRLGYGAMSIRHRVCSVNDSSSVAGIELFVDGGMAQISTRR